MAMRIKPELESKIDELVRTGEYEDAGDVIEQALVLLDDQRKQRYVREMIADAQRSAVANGKVKATPELFISIRDRARADFESGREVTFGPEVWPVNER